MQFTFSILTYTIKDRKKSQSYLGDAGAECGSGGETGQEGILLTTELFPGLQPLPPLPGAQGDGASLPLSRALSPLHPWLDGASFMWSHCPPST